MSPQALVTAILSALVVVAFGLFWWVGSYSDRVFTNRFRTRFPEKTLSYTGDQLGELVQSDLRMKYVFPILFPLDLIVMLALAGAMGAASSHWLSRIYPSAAWLGLVVPAVYLLSDLIEDCLLAWLLLHGDPHAAARSVSILKAITTIKLVGIFASIALTLAAFVGWLFHGESLAI
ncbi:MULTISPECIES: hypothetical protein [Bradyrhizobium]|uniref:hypothetical protein n=1 Tax=Bradyrhizobium TaxID=374 RepID=UPI001E3E822E|nr:MULTISPECIES: hypothetical protein [Bradyrhizobium]MCP1847929.1 hypothetical protein [Bradyrhizobium sp. USDA 4541]MCP1911835.1 hypothetical protein [Bradyrhizobium elkanii]